MWNNFHIIKGSRNIHRPRTSCLIFHVERRSAALRAAPTEWTGTLPAKLHAFRSLKSTAWAAHGFALRHGRASGSGARGQAPRRAPLTRASGILCQYSRCDQVLKRKA